jgi:hypothetical protein
MFGDLKFSANSYLKPKPNKLTQKLLVISTERHVKGIPNRELAMQILL